MPLPVPLPHPGSQSAPNSTSRLHPSKAMETLQVQLETGHWFDSPLLLLEIDTVGTGQTVTVLVTGGAGTNQRGEERLPMGLERWRRWSQTVTLPYPSRRWTTRSWTAPSVASLFHNPEKSWISSTMVFTPPPLTWETAKREALLTVPLSGPTLLRGSPTQIQSCVPPPNTQTRPGLEPSRAGSGPNYKT